MFIFVLVHLIVSIPKRVSEALKLGSPKQIDWAIAIAVSIPKRVSEALKQAIATKAQDLLGEGFNP